MLTNNTRKFWDISTTPGYCYEFGALGDCNYYYYNFSEGSKREYFPFDDIVVTNKWEFINDSIIDINGWKSYFKFLTKDTLELISVKNRANKTILYTSKNQKK